eukprot:gene13868-4815_t
MLRRALTDDPKVAAKGLDPAQVAAHRLTVLFYHPQSSKYVFVKQSSPKLHESTSNYVCMEADYRGEGKQFSLEKVGDNEYYIKAMDRDGEEETGFLYVSEQVSSGLIESSANVLKSEKIAYRKELYIFEFIRHREQMGVYSIRCKENGLTLYGSEDRESHVKADKRDHDISNKNWFKLNMEPDKHIQVSVVRKSAHVLSGSVEPPVYIEEVRNNTKYEYAHRFEDGTAKLSELLSKQNAKEKVALKDRYTVVDTHAPVIKPEHKLSQSTFCYIEDQLKEEKLEIEFKSIKLDGYSVTSYGKRGISLAAGEIGTVDKN